ncbi:MAG: hypothetical protein ABJB40_14560, partial [Acidobacteriota bacterium]
TESLFALLRVAKRYDLPEVYIHCILDGLDVPERTADIYVEALEIKMAEIGIGRVATLCGRFFAMDSGENWERTARAFTMLVHAEGERTRDAVTSIRNSFLRGISDEFIAPIVVEKAPDVPVTTVKDGDLVVFFNHRPETMRQLVRSLCVPDGMDGGKPTVDTVCLTEYDGSYNLPAAFRQEAEKNSLAGVLAGLEIPTVKITEAARFPHMKYFFDGGSDTEREFEQQILVGPVSSATDIYPESQSFKIADEFRRNVQLSPNALFVVNIPAGDLMAETGDIERTVAAVQYIDTCIGGICSTVRDLGGVVLITSSHGNCEEMRYAEGDEPNRSATNNPVPFHIVDDMANGLDLHEDRSLADIAPTVLAIMNIEKPTEMTGSDLRRL